MNWTKNFQLEVTYLRWVKGMNIEISPLDTIKADGACLACKLPMKPFLKVVNQESTAVLEKKICISCGYVQFTTMPSKAWFENFYSSEWDAPGKVTKKEIIDFKDLTQHPNLSMLTKIAPDLDARILDVGAGYGSFLQTAKNRGYRNIHGVEPSEHRSRHCRNHLNLDVTTSYVENCIEVFQSGSNSLLFDVIHSNHVLEHVNDLDIALKNFYQMLKPGGYVFFVVPDWLESETIINMSHFLGHIRHFTPKAFVLLLQRHGFQECQVKQVKQDKGKDTLSISIVGRKPTLNEKITEKEELLWPIHSSVEELVEKKVVNEMFGGDERQFRRNHQQKRFCLANRKNKSSYYHVSDLGLRERISWQIKKSTFGVCHNNAAIRGSRGNLLRLFNLRLVFSKCLTRLLSFDWFELGGLITSKSASKEGEVSPLVEFSYRNKKGLATIK